MLPFNPTDWYWLVGDVTDTVWSSAAMSYVPVTDAGYVAFLARGMATSWVDTPASLGEFMLSQTLPALGKAGVNITSTATPALNGTYPIDDLAQSNMTALSTGIAAGKPLPGGGSTFRYSDIAGNRHAFTATNFLAFAAAIEDYLYLMQDATLTLVNGAAADLPSRDLAIP